MVCATALLHGQAGLGAIQRLNLTLLVDRQDQRMLGRIEIEADNVLQFGGEIRIAADLEAFNTMRLQSVGVPDATHTGLADAHRASHGARGPVGGVVRRALGGFDNDCIDDLGRDPGCAPRPGCVLQKAFDAMLDKPATPKRRHARADSQLLGDLLVLISFHGKQHNAAALHRTGRHRTLAAQPHQFSARGFIDNNGRSDTHGEVSLS
jgi:hypothetical protein